jgi:hypothetical protein
MSSEIVVEFSNGKKLFIGGDNISEGLHEASVTERIKTATAEEFTDAMGTLANLVDVMDASLGKIAKKPSKVEMEFGASLTADCNLWVVSGDGKAEFKVKLTWDNS